MFPWLVLRASAWPRGHWVPPPTRTPGKRTASCSAFTTAHFKSINNNFFYQVVIVSVSVGMFVLREYVRTGGCKGRIKMRVKVPGWRGGGTYSTSARRRRRKMSPRLCSGSSRRCCSRAHTAVPGQWTLKQKVLQGATALSGLTVITDRRS